MTKKILITLTIILSIAVTFNSNFQEVTVLSEEYKPFQYWGKDNEPTGFGIELVTLLFNEAGITVKNNSIDIWPWSKAYKITLEKKNTALFMTVRNNKRENLFKWVGPLAPREMWLYKLKQRTDIQLQNLDDAKNYLIAGYKDSADTNYMQELGFNVKVVSGQDRLTRMLVEKEIDLISSLELSMVARLKDQGLSYDLVEKATLLDGRFNYYLAINKKTDDNIVNKLHTALDKIKKNGAYKEIEDKYLR